MDQAGIGVHLGDRPRGPVGRRDSAIRSRAQRPTPGAQKATILIGSSLGRRSGSPSETRVRVRTRSGRRPATLVATAPPRELPIRCTGQRPRLSISEMTADAAASIE